MKALGEGTVAFALIATDLDAYGGTALDPLPEALDRGEQVDLLESRR